MILNEREAANKEGAPTGDPRASHQAIARRAFEISLTSTASAEENWAEAEAQLHAELAAETRPRRGLLASRGT